MTGHGGTIWLIFTLDRNTDFVEHNANPAAMETLRIHLLVIMDNEGNLLYNRTLSPDFETDTSVPEDLLVLIRNNPRLVHYH